MNRERKATEASNQQPQTFSLRQAMARVELENGRWVVYLNVQSWEPSEGEHPVANNWKRINDYSTQQQADTAASWFEKSANRTFRPPNGF
jgi:hypothetical protein